IASVRAHAADWYVDVNAGSDANDGLAPATAWQTLTHALAQVPIPVTGDHVVHVAPGTYSQTSGETFPIFAKPRVRIVGDGGWDMTIVRSVPSTNDDLFYAGNASDFGPQPLLEGLTLSDAGTGLRVYVNGQAAAGSCRVA